MTLGVIAEQAIAERAVSLFSAAVPVVWTCATFEQGVELARSKPVRGVLISTRSLRQNTKQLNQFSCPVVVIRSGTSADGSIAFDAMDFGAVYVLDLPEKSASESKRENTLRAVTLACRIERKATRVEPPSATKIGAKGAINARRGGAQASKSELPPSNGIPKSTPKPVTQSVQPVVAIGASTGGPPALAQVLAPFAGSKARILLVQHIDPEFIPDMASWLTRQTKVPVSLSSNGLSLVPGCALIASTHDHLIMSREGELQHKTAGNNEIHHPSVDSLFLSLAAQRWVGAAALLTGMGRDGAEGLLALRQAGWFTVAQDEASSAVYGMPRAAKELGAATEVLPLREIGHALKRAVELGR